MTGDAIDFIGFGKYVAKTVETNAEVAARFGIKEEEIVAKSGVECRYIAREESASEMALAAVREAIDDSGLDASELSAVIVCTYSGDYIYPNTASALCRDLNISDCMAFDIQANCAGFQIGVSTARDMLRSNPDHRHIAVVGVAKQSPYLDPNDINTAFFFSDAASAVVMSRVEGEGGILGTFYKTNGRNYEVMRLRGGGSSYPLTHELLRTMPDALTYDHAGIAVWKEVMVEMPALVKKAQAAIGWKKGEVDLVLMHQANLRLIEFIIARVGLEMSNTVTNIQDIGNTADASLGTVIYDAQRQGRLVPGSKIMLASVGAGFVYAVTPYIVPDRG
ncbi:MAG: ketoacyl-ACP synthase III [Magnetovibrio sp.]|nr:ketoacyl-ACP synthase III [Magnetovibrio sp.]